MTQEKTDPRFLRTRKLIMDSFIELSDKKEFKGITRATFYYHFEDKYDLLEKVLSEVLLINLDYELFEKNVLNEEVMVSIFLAITNFQNSLSNRFHGGYEETIARIIKEHLEIIFYKMLLKQQATEEDQALGISSVMLSWGIYGASVEWRRNSNLRPEEFIKLVIPYLLDGFRFESKN